ncbi:MAG TPA: amidohydrolase family protein [Thermoanaerobaculia bacterium]|nr:amidohydrolase family protein [Thermoanaerobaculia bacterium]
MSPAGRIPSLATLALALAAAAHAERVAFTNAVLHPVSGSEVTGGALLVEDGRIVELAVTAPAESDGWRLVDLGGRHVWPGFVDAATDLGLVEVGSVRGTVDTREIGDFNPDLRVEVAFHPDSRRILPTVSGGVLTAHVVPDGDLFLGASAAMRLDGWTWEEMTLAAPVGQHLRYPRAVMRRGGWNADEDEEKFEKERKQALQRLDELIGAARGYDRARAAFESGEGPAVDLDPKLEALRLLLAGEAKLFLWADERNQIGQALDWAKKEGFARVVLVSGADAAFFAERLAAENVAVIVNGVHRLPARNWDPYDAPFAAAAKLHAAGVRIAFSDGESSENARNLPFQAATAVGYGLPREAAHRALTADAAEILGIADRVGSLAAGLEASFVVTDGDPLDIRTTIERVFVRGAEIDLAQDPQRRLWDRYRARPAAASPR